MHPDTTFILVEGPHDAQFIYRLLKLVGYKMKVKINDLPKPFPDLVPTTFPVSEDANLDQRHPVPNFYYCRENKRWVVLLVGGGSKAPCTLANGLHVTARSGFMPTAIGVFIDQDLKPDPNHSINEFLDGWSKLGDLPIKASFSRTAGEITATHPRLGIYVLPDNEKPGALEDLLIECGETNYSQLMTLAKNYRDQAFSEGGLTHSDLKKHGSVEGDKWMSQQKKAWIGAVGSILRPGTAIQNSIQDNRWLEKESLDLPRIQSIRDFLDRLISP